MIIFLEDKEKLEIARDIEVLESILNDKGLKVIIKYQNDKEEKEDDG